MHLNEKALLDSLLQLLLILFRMNILRHNAISPFYALLIVEHIDVISAKSSFLFWSDEKIFLGITPLTNKHKLSLVYLSLNHRIAK